MWRLSLLTVAALAVLAGGTAQAQLFDITAPGDPVVGVPDDDDWPGNEAPPLAIDDQISGFKYLHFKGDFDPDPGTDGTGFRVTPSGPRVVVVALNFATANDAVPRDPISFRLSGSNESIDGPYEVIAEGTIDDMSQATAWPRNEWISAPVPIDNNKAYLHYELLFTDIRDRAAANSMQIGEVELLSDGSLPGAASNPDPADEAIDVARDVILGWAGGELAATHDVYFGTSFEDVNAATRANPMDLLVSQGQTDLTYDPEGLLEYGQTYYWRIDAVNAAPDNTIFVGDVWSFTTELFAYPIEGIVATSNATSEEASGPENTINGSGLNEADEHSTLSSDMWLGIGGAEPVYIEYAFDSVYKMHEMLVWNYNVQFEPVLGFGFKDVTVEYSSDGIDWAVLGDVEFAQATAMSTYAANTTVAFEGVAAKSVRLTVNAGWGMLPQYGLSEVRFLAIPAKAREPEPADAATDVSVATDLSWRAGREAVSHDVYLSTDEAAVADGSALIDSTTGTTTDLDALDLATTYYWKVDEVNEADAVSVWEGSIWSFTTQAIIVIDDFESYDDEENRIYDTWADGLINDTGSIVGYFDAPFAEQTIVHGGGQSMPLEYNNNGVATSEADFDLAQDWSTSGIQSLSLYFYGDAGNSGGQLYVKINNTKIDYDGPAVNITRPSWHLWNIDLSTAGNVSSVNSLTIGVEGAGAVGLIFIDDIGLYPEIFEAAPVDVSTPGDAVQGVPNDGDWPTAESPELAIDGDVGTKYLHRKGGSVATGLQVGLSSVGPTVVTGLALTTANDVPSRDPITFELSGSNTSIDGPYELIAAGDIVDFAGATEWPRFTKNETPIEFENTVAYEYYQIVFPTLRGANENLMQIAEVEFLGMITP